MRVGWSKAVVKPLRVQAINLRIVSKHFFHFDLEVAMSTILSADDLNDFIAPGVACIKPVEIEKTQDYAEIAIGEDGQPSEEGKALAPAQISLQDCLACSGCITSSEAMLVELQSPKEMLSQLEKDRESGSPRIFIASVSHQTRVSLAKAYNMSIELVDAKLRGLFVEKLGFKCVLGTEVGRIVSLEESWREIIEKKNSGSRDVVLSSICPGWTLYAEKTHPEILDYLSSVRSPQQITGNLAKRLISTELQISPEQIYHVSLMPCFDKKLESSRPDFSIQNAREVDLVITAKELVDMLNNTFSMDFPDLSSLSLTSTEYPQRWPVVDQFKSNFGSSSGGYLAYILSRTQQLFENSQLITIPGKNSDFIEFQVLNNEGSPVFKGAQVYGFRNIQNLVRKLKMKKGARGKVKVRKIAKAGSGPASSDPSDFDYVELMACPGGCVNGGGQIGAPANVPAKVWTQESNDVYNNMAQIDMSPELVTSWFTSAGIDATPELLRTHYKPIQKDDSLPAALTVGTQW